MLLALAAGAALTASTASAFRSPGRLSLLDGRWSAGWEERFEQGLPLRRPAASLWDLLRFRIFAEGAPGVLVGGEGWLFTAEEFAAPATGFLPAADALPAAAPVDFVCEVEQALAGRGVQLVVVLVPAKARVYPEHLGRHSMPASLRERYPSVRRQLVRRGVQAPDLLGALREARDREAVFLRTDTHWTPFGAQVAARAAAPAVLGRLARAGAPRQGFATVRGQRISYRGDLLNFVRLGPGLQRWGPPSDTVAPLLSVAPERPGLGLFDRVVIPVVLVGTSYSAGELWGFEAALREALQADVLNLAEEGQGPFRPMQALLEGAVLEDVRADVVIWEIPERYF